MLPPGSVDDGVCGSIANAYTISLLPLRFLAVEKQLSGTNLLITVQLEDVLNEKRLVLESAEDGLQFTPTVFEAVAAAGNHYQFTFTIAAAGNYHRVRAIDDNVSIYSKVLPPYKNTLGREIQQTRAFPNPASNFVYVGHRAK